MEPGALIGMCTSACCCFSFFLAVFGILTVLLRPQRKSRGELEGMAPAPVRGQENRASLTRLEQEQDRQKR